MDYLHGEVVKQEAFTACYYEYARESNVIWKAAQWRDSKFLGHHKKGATARKPIPSKLARKILHALPGLTIRDEDHVAGPPLVDWLNHCPFCYFLCFCRSFPKRDWLELSQAERKAIRRYHTDQAPSLPVGDLWDLDNHGVWESFKWKAANENAQLEQNPKYSLKDLPAIFPKSDSIEAVVFEVDYSKGKQVLVSEFKEWLGQQPQAEKLKKHATSATGTTGLWLDRLKTLTACRVPQPATRGEPSRSPP